MSWRAQNRSKDAKTPSVGRGMSQKPEPDCRPVQPYTAATIKQLEDNRQLTGLTPIQVPSNGDINLSCSLQVSQRGKDRRDHSCMCVLFFQTLVPGLAEKNSLCIVPGVVYVTLRKK
jgi:hypothetical protein